MKRAIMFLFLLLLLGDLVLAQFGQNRVQHKEFEWYYIQTTHFDIYFSEEGKTAAEFCAEAAEDALGKILEVFDHQVNNRIILVMYNSHNDFQETNTTFSYLSQGIGGFTEPFKNRVVIPFEGDYQKFRHVIHHELVHAVINDYYYGGSLQNIISKGITLQLPIWFHEGMAEFLSSGWETMSDQFIRESIINEWLPDVQQLNGYMAYRGGQSLFWFISKKYGIEKITEIIKKTKENGNFVTGVKSALGLSLEELSDKWKKYLKREFWPEIAKREDPEEFAKRLTDNKKDGGFYNSSPVLSPSGDKIAFISDRDIYFNVYIMNAIDGKIIDVVAESGRTNDFEELNILLPALTWAPDNKRIALAVKSGGYDAVQIIDTESKDYHTLPIQMEGIGSVSWSPAGNKIAFIGHNTYQSDIYIFDLEKNELEQVTNDIFTENSPAWNQEGTRVFFASDRGENTDPNFYNAGFSIFEHDISQLDLYYIDITSYKIVRLTDWPLSNETSPVISPDGKEMIFVSDKNGISNIYKKKIVNGVDSNLVEVKAVPLTNSLNGLNELSLSRDGMKLAFSSLYNGGYNIYLWNNPFTKPVNLDELDCTPFMARLIERQHEPELAEKTKSDSTVFAIKKVNKIEPDENEKVDYSDYVFEPEKAPADTTKKEPEIFTGQYISDTPAVEDTLSGSYKNYIFSNNYVYSNKEDTLDQVSFEEKLDKNGNYLLNKYKVNFSPDIVYANAGYSTFYGLLGTTILSFSDVLGNHRLFGTTSMQMDLKNSDYGLAYYYLAKRINIGVELFHTARFVYLTRGYNSELFRFRNYGAVLSATYPLSRFYRLDASLAAFTVSSENLDNYLEPNQKHTYINPSIGFVHDNTLWGYYSPIEGTRYKISLFGNPGFNNHRRSFYSVTWDYRKYLRFWYDNSFVIRVSGGYSGGANPQRFILGGIENWINYKFRTGNIPLENASDFAYLSPAMPMRGYYYGEQNGTKYSLVNIEYRVPLIRYLLTGPLPLLFRNIMGSAFIDAGTAWTENKSLQLFGKDANGNTVTKDLLLGGGFGARTYLLFFLARFDVAWAYDGRNFTKPMYYFSLGTDF